MRLAARQSGAGDFVVLLHGLFGRAPNLGSVARGLAAHCRVVSLDLRNHGESPHAPGMRYETMAEDVLETLDALGIGKCAILGHSMGGKVAMLAALTMPERFSRIVIADIAPVAYRHTNKRVAEALMALEISPSLTRVAADAALAEIVPEPAIRAFLLQNLQFGDAAGWRIGLPYIAEAIADIEGFPDSAGRTYPGATLFIRGGRSTYVKDNEWPAIRTTFPAAQLVTLDGAGHWLHADEPKRFLAEVERFLLDKEGGAQAQLA